MTAPVGVVIKTHGSAAHLGAALDSVVAQHLADWRLVVVSDGADAAAVGFARALAARDPRVTVVEQAPAGVAAARNRGIDELRGQVQAIALLDHDDRLLPDALARLWGVLSAAPPGIIGAHGVGRYIDEQGALLHPGEMERHLRQRLGVEDRRLREWPLDRPTGFANLAFSNCIAVGSALVRASAFARAGSYDLRAVPADDYDMWLRLARLGDFAFVDELVMEYRRGAPTWKRPRGGVAYVRRKLLASPDNTPEQARLARIGFRINERWTIANAVGDAARLAGRLQLPAAARRLARATLHAAAYVRGEPIGLID